MKAGNAGYPLPNTNTTQASPFLTAVYVEREAEGEHWVDWVQIKNQIFKLRNNIICIESAKLSFFYWMKWKLNFTNFLKFFIAIFKYFHPFYHSLPFDKHQLVLPIYGFIYIY